MGKRDIVERLRKRFEIHQNRRVWREGIRTYERERDEAADKIKRLEDQLSTVHASAADNEYSHWQRIEELEAALGDGSINGDASYKGSCKAVNRAREVLVPRKPPVKIFCLH